MLLSDYILQIKGGMTKPLCNAILTEYASSDDWLAAKVSDGGVINKDIRHADTISISASSVIDKNPARRLELDRYIYSTVGSAIDTYRNKFPYVNAGEDTGYELLRYSTGGFYKEHTDNMGASMYREVSCSILINNNFTGGDFSFFGEKNIYTLDQGDILMFPASFIFPHAVLPVTSGERISMVTWFR
jgi:hypothetical protein